MASHRMVVDQLRRELEGARRNPTPVFGLPSGIPTFDARTRGLHVGELSILAARPGHGKTAMAGQIVYNAARWAKENGRQGDILFFEAEMPAARLVAREVARQTGISVSRQLAAEYTDEQSAHIDAVLDELSELPIVFYDQAGIDAQIIETTAHNHRDTAGVLLLVVDHLQLAVRQGGGRAYEATTECIHALRKLRDVIEAPVLVLSQLRRPQGSDSGNRPDVTDLRDSGAIEEAANNVYLLYNPPSTGEDEEGERRAAELIVRKARDGWTGTIRLQFDPDRVCFEEPAPLVPDYDDEKPVMFSYAAIPSDEDEEFVP